LIALLLSEKKSLKLSMQLFPELNPNQIKQVLTKYVPEEYEQPININPEDIPDSNEPILLETSVTSPLPVGDLHVLDAEDLLSYPPTPQLYKKLHKFTFVQKSLLGII
jgi:hypothetical protein